MAYANSFHVPQLLDDKYTLTANPSIRHLWPPGDALNPPASTYSYGRPLLNLSFALNYALGGLDVQGYHMGNLLVHLAGALVLFGLVRRTLQLPLLGARFGPDAPWLALAVAGIWALHPVQTSSVTYLSQRAESLMGLCYLATFYCLLRGATVEQGRRWYAAGVVCCAAGMGVKEVMVTAPFLWLVFDRIFLAASFREIWQRRRWLYAALGGCWVLLAYLMISAQIGTRVGFHGAFTAWTYLLVECRVVLRYLGLALWPRPLVFDYGPEIYRGTGFWAALPAALLLGGLFGASLFATLRGRALGFLGLAYFVLLAPTSSVIPVELQPMAESRLYLPLIPVVSAGVLLAYRFLGRPALVVALILAAVHGGVSHARNGDYADAIGIWQDTVAKVPGNSRAYYNLAVYQMKEPELVDAAVKSLEATLALNPDHSKAHNNLAVIFSKIPGREADAQLHYEAAIRLEPKHPMRGTTSRCYWPGNPTNGRRRLPSTRRLFA